MGDLPRMHRRPCLYRKQKLKHCGLTAQQRFDSGLSFSIEKGAHGCIDAQAVRRCPAGFNTQAVHMRARQRGRGSARRWNGDALCGLGRRAVCVVSAEDRVGGNARRSAGAGPNGDALCGLGLGAARAPGRPRRLGISTRQSAGAGPAR